MRYRLRTLLIFLALGPPLIWWLGPKVGEVVLDAWTTKAVSTDPAGRIIVGSKYYGSANPGDRVLLKTRGRIYVNGRLREPIEPWMPRSQMPHYSLRTLLILLAVLPPLLCVGWGKYQAWKAERERLVWEPALDLEGPIDEDAAVLAPLVPDLGGEPAAWAGAM